MKFRNKILVFILLCTVSTTSCTTRNDSAKAIDEDIFIKTTNTKLFANIRGSDNSMPILLYLHGGPGSPLGIPIFKAYSGYQLEKDFIVVYLHQRGIMKSERVADNEHKISNYIQDIHDVVSYLKNRFQNHEIFLLGHSWGGLISYMYLLEYENEVDKFVAVCTPLNSKTMINGRIEMILQWALNTNNQQAIEELKVLQNNSMNLSEEESVVLVNWMSKANGGWHRNLEFKKVNDAVNYEDKFPEWLEEQKHIESLLKDEILNINLTDSIKKINTPLLCLTGKEDTSVPWYIVKKEIENYGGPKTFKLFDNSHHMVFVDEEKLFIETVTNYLKEKN